MKVGLVGWRGMVGSVLMQRMVEENDFAHIEPFYFSTSNAGGEAPSFGGKTAPALMDASDINSLKQMDVILTCQGGDYTSEIFPNLKLKVGMVIGLMLHLHFVWQMMQSSYLIQST
jgi:aspartate-semialdehyde dehydrogenase